MTVTLDELAQVQHQLEAQYNAILVGAPTDGKEVIKHTNLIELCGARQVIRQLIQQEQVKLAAPPGSTGPIL